MPRIENLTDAQIARFPEFVKRWTDIGLCTKPADRSEAEAGIIEAYKVAGLEPPKRIVWCGSPFSQGLTRAIVMGLSGGAEVTGDSVRDSVRASVRASVWASVGDSVGASVWDSVRDSVGASVWASVGDSVGDSVWASVRASVWDSVGDSVWDSVGDSVRASVWASVGDSVGASVWASEYGQHDAEWLAFYEYFREACGLSEQTQKLCGLWKIAKSANWWLPHKNICWVSERHNLLNRDSRGRLHCEDGAALAYPDGWCIFAINGVLVDEQIILRPETQTIQQISAEGNEEIRRIRIERYGWVRWLKETGAKVIDGRKNEIDQQRECLVQDKSGIKRLLVSDPSTARVYALGVPREVANCEQAQLFLSHGLSAHAIHRS